MDGCGTGQEVSARYLLDEQLDRVGCRVLTAPAWRSWLSSDDVQIDHVVPLAYAWQAGAWAWTDAAPPPL